MKDKETPKKAILSKFDQDVISVLKKLQHQMDAIERKVNTLLKSSKPRTFREGAFSKTPREYNHLNRNQERNYKDNEHGTSGDGKFYHGRPFTRSKNPGKSHFRSKKK